jgi:hypothetical protein
VSLDFFRPAFNKVGVGSNIYSLAFGDNLNSHSV